MIVDMQQLRKLCGRTQRSAVRRWLTANGIAFMVQPSGDLVTTLDAINRALYGSSKYNRPDLSATPCFRRKSTKGTAATTTSTGTPGTR